MDTREFYDYLQENFTLGGTSSRLIRNILEYVEREDFVDAEDARAHLWHLLGGAFGLEEREVQQYRAHDDEEPPAPIKPSLRDMLKANDERSREQFGAGENATSRRREQEL